MPTPGGADTEEPDTGLPDRPRDETGDLLQIEPRKGRVQQVQIAEAICIEAGALLSDCGLLGRVPVIFAGDFNARPGDAVHTLLTSGSLPPSAPELHPRTTDGGKAARRARAVAADPVPSVGSSTEPTDTVAPAVKAEKSKAVPADVSLAKEVTLPYPSPTCGLLGSFRSAYAAAHGSEPETTTYRLFGKVTAEAIADVTLATSLAEAGVKRAHSECDIEDESKALPPQDSTEVAPTKWVTSGSFSGTLDYIFFANPRIPGVEHAAAAAVLTVVPQLTPALPTEAELLESLASEEFAALPCSTHPSDHLPVVATFRLEQEYLQVEAAYCRRL